MILENSQQKTEVLAFLTVIIVSYFNSSLVNRGKPSMYGLKRESFNHQAFNYMLVVNLV